MQFEQTIQIDNELVYLHYKKIKNLYLTVNPTSQQIEVKAPFHYPIKKIIEFVQKNKVWIAKRRLKINNNPIQKPVQFNQNSIHYLIGKEYTLNIIETTEKSNISTVNNTIIRAALNPLEKWTIESLMYKFYFYNLNEVLKGMFAFYKNKINLYPQKLIIKKLKSRWGYCYPHNQLICMNIELAKYSMECIEFVYVHELVHLLEPSHNERFKKLLTEFLPQWKTWSQQLKQGHLC